MHCLVMGSKATEPNEHGLIPVKSLVKINIFSPYKLLQELCLSNGNMANMWCDEGPYVTWIHSGAGYKTGIPVVGGSDLLLGATGKPAQESEDWEVFFIPT
jgi:hypothetical protein